MIVRALVITMGCLVLAGCWDGNPLKGKIYEECFFFEKIDFRGNDVAEIQAMGDVVELKYEIREGNTVVLIKEGEETVAKFEEDGTLNFGGPFGPCQPVRN